MFESNVGAVIEALVAYRYARARARGVESEELEAARAFHDVLTRERVLEKFEDQLEFWQHRRAEAQYKIDHPDDPRGFKSFLKKAEEMRKEVTNIWVVDRLNHTATIVEETDGV